MRAAVGVVKESERVEVAYHPEIYEAEGFHGVLRHIRGRHRGTPVHAIHGSDVGGMMVRAIIDECGWIYPLAVRRVDGISATAIRNGATGMTSNAVDEALARLAAEQSTPTLEAGRVA